MRARTQRPMNSCRRVGGATIQALYECRDCHCGQVGDEKVHVVGFAVELDQLDIEIGAHVCAWCSRRR